MDRDPDPSFYFNENRIRHFTLIRILLIIKVMQICGHLAYKPLALHFKPPGLRCECHRLHFEPLKILNLDFDADADRDPACRNNMDPDPLPCFATIIMSYFTALDLESVNVYFKFVGIFELICTKI